MSLPSTHKLQPARECLRGARSHLALLGALFCYESPQLILPFGVFLLLFWFFPRVVRVLITFFVAWLLWPPLLRLRAHILAVLESPYGSGEAPQKIKGAEEAVRRRERRHAFRACPYLMRCLAWY